MISGIYVEGTDKKVEDAFYVRRKVFVEEQGIDESIDFDVLDHEAIHVILYDNDNPVGTGRLINREGSCLLGRIAVLSEHRGQRYGDLIVKMLLDKAFRIGINEVHLHSQMTAKDFYEKIGFKAYGKVYKEADIDHISMVITPEDLVKCQH